MAEPQISTVLIPCLVIQLNNQKFILDDEIYGQVLEVPCRNCLIDDFEYWAVPIKDSGIFETWQYILIIDNGGVSVAQPTFDSFKVVRVRDKLTNYVWWIYGTRDQFITSCDTAIQSPPIPMPGTTPGFLLRIAPCQTFCDITNVSGAYQAIFGIPTLTGTQTYFPFGSYNNTALAAASPTGYANQTLLLTFLNTSWTNQGSPSKTLTWTISGDGLTLTVTGGNLSDVICAQVVPLGT